MTFPATTPGAIPGAFFVSGAPQPRTVTLPDGTEHVLHFRQLPAAAWRRFSAAVQDKDHDAQSRAMAGIIAASLCTPEGGPALTPEQAMDLTPAAERALSDAVMAVNGLGPREERALGNA